MSKLTSDLLRTILIEIFFAEADRLAFGKYIVPKQGNWYNPQDTKTDKIATWIGYNIPFRKGKIRARLDQDEEHNEENIVSEIVTIELQFIGAKAEEIALSVMHWNSRTDVHEAFSVVSGQLFDEEVRVIQSIYKQDGLNTIYAYNIKRRLMCENTQLTGASQLLHFTASGQVIS